MIVRTAPEVSSQAAESQAVRETMADILRKHFAEQTGEPLDTRMIFNKVMEERHFVKPIDLSRALLDLMENRVVKWDINFQLVPVHTGDADR
jgi:hypothetical protein